MKNKFSEFQLELRDKFTKFWLEYFEYFKYYLVQVSQKHKPSNSNVIEFKIAVVKIVEFSSLE